MTDAAGRHLSFDYYVLIEEAVLGETFCCENYGVRIADTAGQEAMEVPNITTSTRRIDELVELLVQGEVTPSSLKDVVEDWLAAG